MSGYACNGVRLVSLSSSKAVLFMCSRVSQKKEWACSGVGWAGDQQGYGCHHCIPHLGEKVESEGLSVVKLIAMISLSTQVNEVWQWDFLWSCCTCRIRMTMCSDVDYTSSHCKRSWSNCWSGKHKSTAKHSQRLHNLNTNTCVRSSFYSIGCTYKTILMSQKSLFMMLQL